MVPTDDDKMLNIKEAKWGLRSFVEMFIGVCGNFCFTEQSKKTGIQHFVFSTIII